MPIAKPADKIFIVMRALLILLVKEYDWIYAKTKELLLISKDVGNHR